MKNFIKANMDSFIWELELIPRRVEFAVLAQKQAKAKRDEEKKVEKAEKTKAKEAEKAVKQAYEEKKAAEEENVKQEERIKLFNELFEINPWNRIIPLGFRRIKINATNYYSFQNMSCQYVCDANMEVIEIIQNGHSYYLYSGNRRNDKLGEDFLEKGYIFYSPDSLNKIEDVMKGIIPQFAQITITVNEEKYRNSLMAPYEMRNKRIEEIKVKLADYGIDDTGKIKEWTSNIKTKDMNDDSLNKCLEICNSWHNNYAVKFGREAYEFWKPKMLEMERILLKEKSERPDDSKVVKAGKEGEEAVEYVLKWLPLEYTVIEKGANGIHLRCQSVSEKSQEIDHIVVSPKGVFLIETKNYAGEIVIDEHGNWIRYKLDGSCVGEENPVGQVYRHRRVVDGILGEVDICDVVCIANSKAILKGVEHSPVPVIKADMLLQYFSDYKNESGKEYSDEEIKEIVKRIEEHRVKTKKRGTDNEEETK